MSSEISTKNWVDGYTVHEIHEANLARQLLRRKYGVHTKPTIPDSRFPTKYMNAYVSHFKARALSPEYQGVANQQEKLKMIAEEWKQLSPEARKVCLNQSLLHFPAPVDSIRPGWLLINIVYSSLSRRWRKSTRPGTRRRWKHTGRELPRNKVLQRDVDEKRPARAFVHYDLYAAVACFECLTGLMGKELGCVNVHICFHCSECLCPGLIYS